MGVIAYPLAKVQRVDGNTANIEAQRALYPNIHATNGWTSYDNGKGEYTVQGKKWPNDAKMQFYGDPTTKLNDGNSWAYMKLNTGANHDCNIFWGSNDVYKNTERQVRGIYFRHHTNGAKFRPRITGVALRYSRSNGAICHVGLRDRWNASGNNCMHSSGGTLPFEGTTSGNNFWGIAKRGTTDGNPFHDSDWTWSGVLFHFETTWKSGSAADCIVYLKCLRPILDGDRTTNPLFNNKHRVWGVRHT